MTKNFEIKEMTQVSDNILHELSLLLINVVEGGASVGFLPSLSIEDAKQYWKEALTTGVILWVVQIRGRILGTVQLHLCQKQNGKHRAEIAKLMVHSDVRREGLGKHLMESAEERAKIEQRNLITLDTKSGDPSNLLYQSIGYIEAGRIPKYAKSHNGSLHETIFYYKQM
ncbi:acetyltransferase [Clostridium puniceum]|uniref:Acetyltransferase n=1 Tax=Clostridium puniceum TaxID=29367 RepID=A0A1S8TW15_9CLOT|nr:GNAT family N-acetyltransferase [Clostridium puniceum]OOM81957.1 acetyltransferase [Clostridium puniceum]